MQIEFLKLSRNEFLKQSMEDYLKTLQVIPFEILRRKIEIAWEISGGIPGKTFGGIFERICLNHLQKLQIKVLIEFLKKSLNHSGDSLGKFLWKSMEELLWISQEKCLRRTFFTISKGISTQKSLSIKKIWEEFLQ